MDRTSQPKTENERIKELETRNLMIHITMTFLLSVIHDLRSMVDIETWGKVNEAERKAFAAMHYGGGWPARDVLYAAKELSDHLDAAGIIKDHPLRKNLTDALKRIPWIQEEKTERRAG